MLKLLFAYCDASMRKKDLHCRKRGMQAMRARQGDLARETLACGSASPFRAFTRTKLGSLVELAPLIASIVCSKCGLYHCVAITLYCNFRTKVGPCSWQHLLQSRVSFRVHVSGCIHGALL